MLQRKPVNPGYPHSYENLDYIFFINLRVQAFLEYPNIWDRDSLKKNPPPQGYITMA